MNDQGTALVVGGSSGIGKAAARKLLARGAEVILLGRNPTKLAAAKAELSALGAVETIAVDLHDESHVQAFIEKLDAEERHLRYLVNAAGVFKPTPFFEHDIADYDKYHGINRAVFFITQAVARNRPAITSSRSTACVVAIRSAASDYGHSTM